MKITTNTKVYVQKNDIAFLNQTDLAIPASVYMKLFENGIIFINDDNRYDFYEFDKFEEIDFFDKIDWMIEYTEVKDLSEERIIRLGQSIIQEKNRIARVFNSMKSEEREKNKDLVLQCELLDFKLYSLRDFLWFKQGHIKIELPEEVDYPIDFRKEKGLVRLLKNIFNKKNN